MLVAPARHKIVIARLRRAAVTRGPLAVPGGVLCEWPNGPVGTLCEEDSMSLQKIMIRGKSDRTRAFTIIKKKETAGSEAAGPDSKGNPSTAK
jgi:hypothetical protein